MSSAVLDEQPHAVTDGEQAKDPVARRLDVGETEEQQPKPAPEPTLQTCREEEDASGEGELAERRFSAPANLIATWMKGVSDTIGRGSAGSRLSLAAIPGSRLSLGDKGGSGGGSSRPCAKGLQRWHAARILSHASSRVGVACARGAG